MPYDEKQGVWEITDEMVRLQKEKHAAIEVQEHKHNDWNENYELYRNKVKTNRLTQRQAVNIPLMKETVKTLMAKSDDPPNVDWREKSGDEVKSLYFQEIWNDQFEDNKVELIDILDKKNVFLYGQSTKKLNLYDEGVDIQTMDIYDILLDPLMLPGQIETSRFVIHQNIYKTVREVLADERYTKAGKEEVKIWADSPPGIQQSQTNRESWEDKMERLRAMGMDNEDFEYFAAGDKLLTLTEHFTTRWNKEKKDFERRVVTYAEDSIKLRDVTLEEAIGVDFWPFVNWSEDPETNDVYPDSVADLVRVPNKIANIWYSQLVENRTLKNFQMHWYTPMEGYEAKTYTPGPGVMIPAPPGDDINKVLKPVEISSLDDTFDAINAITTIVERGSGATAIDKGQSEKSAQTLGEVEILVGKAQERAVSTAKFYRMAWQELADKWAKMLHANAPDFFKLYKEAASGKIYLKKIFKNDWYSENGYKAIVRSSSEQEESTMKSMQKWLFVTQQNPENPALREIAMSRMLDLLDVTPAEMQKIEEGQAAQEQMLQAAQSEQKQTNQSGQPTPADDAMLEQEISNKLAELQQI